MKAESFYGPVCLRCNRPRGLSGNPWWCLTCCVQYDASAADNCPPCGGKGYRGTRETVRVTCAECGGSGRKEGAALAQGRAP